MIDHVSNVLDLKSLDIDLYSQHFRFIVLILLNGNSAPMLLTHNTNTVDAIQ